MSGTLFRTPAAATLQEAGGQIHPASTPSPQPAGAATKIASAATGADARCVPPGAPETHRRRRIDKPARSRHPASGSGAEPPVSKAKKAKSTRRPAAPAAGARPGEKCRQKRKRRLKYPLAAYGSIDPLRSPEWRWETALRVLVWDVRLAPDEDAALRRAVEFRSARQRAPLDAAAREPDLNAAVGIFEAGGPLRDELEARLLAAESAEAIAGKVGVAVKVVEAFELLFFDLGARARDWVQWRVLRVPFGSGLRVDDGTLLRNYGWHGGPVMLDSLVEYLRAVRAGLRPSDQAAEVYRGCRFLLDDLTADYRRPAVARAWYRAWAKEANAMAKRAPDWRRRRELSLRAKALRLLANSAGAGPRRTGRRRSANCSGAPLPMA